MISDKLDIKKGITSIIGSGGKTTLMYVLALELSKKGKVIVTTSTKIYRPENIITLENPSEEDIKFAFQNNDVLCIGKTTPEGKFTAPDLDFWQMEEFADYILCEADGSKGLPLKAHSGYEPVIPKNSVKTIQVLGIKGINKTIKDVCHRPELYAKLAGTDIYATADAETVAEVIKRENLCDLLIINQAESPSDMKNARAVAALLDITVWAGEIRKGNLICLHS